jgi:hypothetical protein
MKLMYGRCGGGDPGRCKTITATRYDLIAPSGVAEQARAILARSGLLPLTH